MKVYIVLLLQFIIWSSYTITEWLSKHDHPLYNVLMFLVFFYLALVICQNFIASSRNSFILTLLSLCLYAALHICLAYFQVASFFKNWV
ncbi:hypothetical protein D1B31_22745 [Neobacillus notoginsengisoli]|uniref:Uncharacterized protein n=1 Tax=Neobacillus notoginsengisoli TaxID=1578198 RepID=A0A417YEL9_9BACI|nr:hypothetical protein D1B31_22745 [Neobacillus notoginsengisoli]